MQPGEHDGPVRTCVGCRHRRSQRDLVRCTLGADGRVHIDRHGPGRGAWLCGPDCLGPALRHRGFDRAFRRSVHPSQCDGLEAELRDRAQGPAGVPDDGRR